MERIIAARTRRMVRKDLPKTKTLNPQMVEAAILRLGWISLTCAILVVLLGYLDSRLQPETPRLGGTALLLVWLTVVLISLGLNAIQHFRLLKPISILNLGLAFEVVVAAAISFSETTRLAAPDQPVLGVSKVALWIGIVGLLIPGRPWVKFVTALASASTWPLAYALNLSLVGYQPLPVNRLVAWIHLPYVMAFVSFALSKRTYRMEADVHQARDLGSYHLVSLIGAGGMGEVWRASHRMLARDAAVKVIRADRLLLQPGYESEVTRKRFAQEAQVTASLQSPHTVHLFDFGVSEDGSFYYAMELLDGINLQTMVEKFGPQPPSRTIHLLQQVCDSLEEAHRRGLIHRDIKPNNIFACTVGIECDFAKVLDFGLVKNVVSQDPPNLTCTGTTAGTPAYIAPEIAMGERRIDGRVDLYSLGCVAYFLLTGSLVFDEKSATATAMAHVLKTPVPPSQQSEMPVPQQLEDIILSCLAKQPEERPKSARDLKRLLGSVSGVPAWTQEQASEWWRVNLPPFNSHRIARHCHGFSVDSSEPYAQPGIRNLAG